jgi:formylglycine-generating enzyme required for sulfatase activity
MMIKRITIIIIALLFPFFTQAQEKFALVIGNANYIYSNKLKNPINDAVDMRSALQSLGFQVDYLSDVNIGRMKTAIINFKNKLSNSPNSYGFFYFAGHGLQSSGENYLIPVDTNINNVNLLPQLTLPVQYVLDELEGVGNILNVVVLDACRNLPVNLTRGLSAVSELAEGTIIIYAAGAGQPALDGTGRNGLFTAHLLRHIKTQGIEVKELFNRTREDVIQSSDSTQVPALFIQFSGTAYLGVHPIIPDPPPVPPPLPPPPVPPAPVPPEILNMVKINGGTFIMGSPDSETGRFENEGPQHRVTVSSFYMKKYPVTVGDFRQFTEDTWYKTEAEIRDGGFIWTGNEWQNKKDANWKNPYFSQDDNHPVVLVSWIDAIWYCNWLSGQEGLTPAYTINGKNISLNRRASGYRLPTEAEWEYACRAGTVTPFNTGNTITVNQANYNRNINRTTPVGIFRPNTWGLYDMHGNVDEWCGDWDSVYTINDQTDPFGPRTGFYRAVRGGGWYDNIQNIRSASRGFMFPSGRNNRLGFRIVRGVF